MLTARRSLTLEPPPADDDKLSRLQREMAAAGLALWRWDAYRGARYADSTLQIAGVGRAELQADADCMRRMVHPDDVEALRRLDEAMAKGLPFDAEYRIVRPDGDVRWLAHHARAEPAAYGRPAALVGSIANITDRKRAEQRLHHSHDELAARVHERTDLLARRHRLVGRRGGPAARGRTASARAARPIGQRRGGRAPPHGSRAP